MLWQNVCLLLLRMVLEVPLDLIDSTRCFRTTCACLQLPRNGQDHCLEESNINNRSETYISSKVNTSLSKGKKGKKRTEVLKFNLWIFWKELKAVGEELVSKWKCTIHRARNKLMLFVLSYA